MSLSNLDFVVDNIFGRISNLESAVRQLQNFSLSPQDGGANQESFYNYASFGGFILTGDTLQNNDLEMSSDGWLQVGDGNDIVRLDATDATYRIWVGNATPGSASFNVTKAGVMSATNATISGTLTAGSSEVQVGPDGIIIVDGTADINRIRWRSGSLSGDVIASIYGDWAGGAGDASTLSMFAVKQSTMTVEAQVSLQAVPLAGASTRWIVQSDNAVYALNVDFFGCYDASTQERFSWTDGSGLTQYDSSGNLVTNLNTLGAMRLDQQTDDSVIVDLRSTGDVAHGMTGQANSTATFLDVVKASATGGGVRISAFRGGTATSNAFILRGAVDSTTTSTKSTSAVGIFTFVGAEKSGTGFTDVTANGNLIAVRQNATTTHILDSDGDIHCDAGGGYGNSVISGATVSGYNTFDDYNDIALLNGLRASLAPDGHEIRERFQEFIEYARPILENTGIVHYNEDSDCRPFVSLRGLNFLTIDALRQFAEFTVKRMEYLESAMLNAGIELPEMGEKKWLS